MKTPRLTVYSLGCAVALLGGAAPAAAELRQVQLAIPGMDCAFCTQAARKNIKKLDGIEWAEFSIEKGAFEIRLKPDNTITLPQLRRIIRSNGFQTKDAEITARGRIVAAGGTSALDLLNGSTLPLADAPADATTAIVEITGRSRADENNAERLTITSIK